MHRLNLQKLYLDMVPLITFNYYICAKIIISRNFHTINPSPLQVSESSPKILITVNQSNNQFILYLLASEITELSACNLDIHNNKIEYLLYFIFIFAAP